MKLFTERNLGLNFSASRQETGVRIQNHEVDLDGGDSRKPARTFEDLLVWKKAHEFVLSVYKFSASFPQHELYGLTLQMRSAAVSIPSNIAAGFKKTGQIR